MERVADYWRNGHWDQAKVNIMRYQTGMPQQLAEGILEVPIFHGNSDVPRWSLARDGNFSVASAWESSRSRRSIIPALGDVWNEGLTTSISIFMWRLISNRIPVDTKLQWRNIELASKCHCCSDQPNIESLQHLFVSGQGACRVWRFFDEWFDGSTEPLLAGDSVPTRLERWTKRIEQPGKAHLSRTLPCIIYWFIWAERNNCRHKEARFRPFSIIWQVRMYIQRLVESGRIKLKHFEGLHKDAMPPTAPRPRASNLRAIAIKWHPPDFPWVKLNIMGKIDLVTMKASGGGVIRDHRGNLAGAFSTPLSVVSDLEAELETICLGMSLAKRLGHPTWVETSSRQAKALVNSKDWGPASIRHVMVKIRRLQQDCLCKFSYVPPEGNKAATSMAHLGENAQMPQEFDEDSAPRILIAMIRLEQMGIPNVRLESSEEGP